MYPQCAFLRAILRHDPELAKGLHDVGMDLSLKRVRVVDELASGVPDEVIEALVCLEGIDLDPLGLRQRAKNRAQVVLIKNPKIGLPEFKDSKNVLVRLHSGNVFGEELAVLFVRFSGGCGASLSVIPIGVDGGSGIEFSKDLAAVLDLERSKVVEGSLHLQENGGREVESMSMGQGIRVSD